MGEAEGGAVGYFVDCVVADSAGCSAEGSYCSRGCFGTAVDSLEVGIPVAADCILLQEGVGKTGEGSGLLRRAH